MGQISMVGTTHSDEADTFRFTGGSATAIADKIAVYMAGRGYHLESGDRSTAVYGRGSAAAHALLGGMLARRSKINITVSPDGDAVSVVIAKGMTGMGGGFIGKARTSAELQNVILGLEQTLLT